MKKVKEMAEIRLIDGNELRGIESLLNTDIIQASKEASWLMTQVLHDIDAMPAIDPEALPIVRQLREELERVKKKNKYSAHDVALILSDAFGDSCACNFNGNDEWLPEKCELLDTCPDVVGVACWEQYLKWLGQKED